MPNQDQNKPQSAHSTQSGSFAKEADMPRASEQPLMQEIAEYEVPKEVASHVEKVPEHVDIPPDLLKIGVKTPHSHGKVSDTLEKELQLPMTNDQIGAWRKADPKLSATWLANWCEAQMLRAGYYLKQIGQHFIPVKKEK